MNDKRLGGKFIQLRRLPRYNHNTTQWTRIQIHKYTNTQIQIVRSLSTEIEVGDIRYSQHKHIFNTFMYLKQIKEKGFAVELSWSFRGWHLHGGSCSWCMCNFVIL